MTGRERYHAAVARARKRNEELHRQFIAGEIDILPCSGDDERREIIAEMNSMQFEIDAQHKLLKSVGLDGAAGQAAMPQKQTMKGLFG